MIPEPPGRLEEEIKELRQRIDRLEQALIRQRVLDPGWLAGAAQTKQAVEATPPVTAQGEPSPPEAQIARTPSPLHTVLRGFDSQRQKKDEPERTLESRIGSQWFNRIGILAVLIAMAWFLKLAIDNRWVGPLGRVLVGLLAGGGLIAWSERFRSHGYAAFAYSLKSVASGMLYLSLWAAFSLYQLIAAPAAFTAMVAVTAFNGFLSWVQDAELLAFYAIAGGFITPALVSTGENREIDLFSYMLLLDVAVLILAALRPWSRLLFAAFAGTVFYATGWSFSYYSARQAGRTEFFFACFFLIFALAPRLVRIHTGPMVYSSPWDKLTTILLPLFNAAIAFIGFYMLLESTDNKWAQPWLAVAFAGVYMLLLRLPARGRWRVSPFLLPELHLSLAVVFLTIAIALEASGRWITIGWLAEGSALLWVATRTRLLLLRVLALSGLVLALLVLVVVNPPASATPIFNQRFATYLVAIAAFAFCAWLASRASADEKVELLLRWRSIATAAALIVNALILAAVSLEIHAYWGSQRWQAQTGLYDQYRMYAQFSYSAVFMSFGAILLWLGFARHSSFLRWQALVVLAVTVGKVFLVDVSELNQGYRILSFLGLGALLLAVSFVYQRDWFNLRGHGGRTK